MTTGAFDLIALGETMLSLVATDGELEGATTFRATHGGAESNACAAFARRGARAAWVSRLGDDVAGARVRAALSAAGVDLSWVRTDPTRPTGLMLRDRSSGVAYWRSGSAASALEPEDLEGVPLETARAVLVTGITAMLGPGPQRAAVALLGRAGGLKAVDPNLRPGLWGSDRAVELISPLLARCDVVLGGEAELRAFAEGDGQALARACASLGPREVVVKRGAAGAAALDPLGRWHVHEGRPADEVDPVGAGDAFNAAYLAARIEGRDVPEALEAGSLAGAGVAASLGDTGRLR
ncbi:MAG: sugar kinase [Actinomycetota bacterium]